MTHVQDDLGFDFELPHQVHRVVSLVPSLTEAIARTLPGRLVGATDWCTQPADLDVVRVRGTKNPDLALICKLWPDLVVANQEENRKLDVARLRAAGIPVWVTRIDDVASALGSLARLFEQAFGVVERPDWLTAADRIWHLPATMPGLRVAVPVWRDPWIWVGAGTYAHDLLARLGLVNVAATKAGHYPNLDVAELLAESVDLILLPDEPYRFCAADGPDALEGVPTVLVPGRALFWYGPAMTTARDILVQALVNRSGSGSSS